MRLVAGPVGNDACRIIKKENSRTLKANLEGVFVGEVARVNGVSVVDGFRFKIVHGKKIFLLILWEHNP